MTLSVLGTEYTIILKKYDEDEEFKRRSIDGYCDSMTKQIVICEMSTYQGCEHESPDYCEKAQKHALRHEITHAFFFESGLGSNSFEAGVAWAMNEEMIDWFAWQGAKLYQAWKEAGAL